jgi:hypothetical protein
VQAQISHWEENLEEHIIIALVDYYLPRINRFCCLCRRRSATGRRTWSGCRWSSSGCAATWPPSRPGSYPTPRSKSTFCQFVPISVENYSFSMFEIIFDRNGAKAYVKNLRVLSKIRGTWLYEIF